MNFVLSFLFGAIVAFPLSPLMFAAVQQMRYGRSKKAHAVVQGCIAANALWIAVAVGLLSGVELAKLIFDFVVAHRRIIAFGGGMVGVVLGLCVFLYRDTHLHGKMPSNFRTTLSVALCNPDRMFAVVLFSGVAGICMEDTTSGIVSLCGLVFGDAAMCAG